VKGGSHRTSALRAVLRSLPAAAVWLGAAVAWVFALQPLPPEVQSGGIVVVGLIGAWRYAWLLLNHARGAWFRSVTFPRLRAAMESLPESFPERLYFVIPSFREEPRVSARVFTALVGELRALPCKRTVVLVSVATTEEAAQIRTVVESVAGHERIELLFMQQNQGKRVAMGHALRRIARDQSRVLEWRARARDDLVVFMDGDSVVGRGSVARTLGFFRLDPRLGALTTDEEALVTTPRLLTQEWYRLKFMRRHALMSSHALARKVLTLTGRFSVFRASIVLSEDFIRELEADHLDHWLFGRFRFLMGDDKSTWYHLLKHGWNMLYVPDVMVWSVESRRDGFLRLSTSLMRRWYGNMVRNNARALALGPARTGVFVWLSILDQRMSMWTTLIGPLSALLLSLSGSWIYLQVYGVWVICTRLLQLWLLALQGNPISVLHLPLLVYDQWVGSSLKVWALFHQNRQSWGKNASRSRARDAGAESFVRRWLPTALSALWVVAFVLFVGTASGAWKLPRFVRLQAASRADEPLRIDVTQHGVQADDCLDDSAPLNRLLRELPSRRTLELLLPEGRLWFAQPLVIQRSFVVLAGRGIDRTTIDSAMSKTDAGRVRAVIAVQGRQGPDVARLSRAGREGDRVLALEASATWPRYAPVAWIGTPNDDDLWRSLGEPLWWRETPWLRQGIVPLARLEAASVDLRRPLPLDLPAGSVVRAPSMPHAVQLRGFTLRQQVPGHRPEEADHRYENLFDDYVVDGIRFEWARDSELRDVAVIMAGSDPVVLESSLDVRLSDLRVEGAWNKGAGGRGYVRFSRTFESSLKDSVVRGIRHVAFQWSSAYNRIDDSLIEVDVNFHGGASHHNRVDAWVRPPREHPWKAVTRTPIDARWAPPDGPGNDAVLRRGRPPSALRAPFPALAPPLSCHAAATAEPPRRRTREDEAGPAPVEARAVPPLRPRARAHGSARASP
jgi:glycosyltransferase Alg8